MKIRGQRIIPPIERIQSGVEIDSDTGCWVWQGAKKGKYMQYGHLTVGSRTDGSRRTMSAHRYSYEIYNGKIPNGLFVLHKCDNPPCVNPDHLFLGTHQDNVDDREKKGRNNTSGISLSGEDHPYSILTLDNVGYIRRSCLKRGDITRIAKELGVNRKTISDVVNFKTWIPEPPNE